TAEQQAALTATREAFERQRDAWQTERDQLQTRITQELDRCQRQLAELNRIRQDLDRERAAWDEHRQAEEAELADRHKLLECQSAELESHAQRIEQQRAMLTANLPAASPSSEASAGGWSPTAAQAQAVESPHDPASEAPAAHSDIDEVQREEEVFARLRTFSLLKPPAADQHERQKTPAAMGIEDQPAATE